MRDLERQKLERAILLGALFLSLAAVACLSLRLSSERSGCSAIKAEAERALASVDTLRAAGLLLAAGMDSLARYRAAVEELEARLAADSVARSFDGYYLVIDTGQNRFQLRYGDLLVRSGYCGTGKGWTSNDMGQTWDFATPRGLRYVLETGTNPYWYRPDWYWLEQNMRPPTPDQIVVIPESLSYDEQIAYYNDSLTPSERVYVRRVPGTLGRYVLDLGGGVLLHYGTGRGSNVSHGCIRLGSADLEAIYRTLPVGAPVLIY